MLPGCPEPQLLSARMIETISGAGDAGKVRPTAWRGARTPFRAVATGSATGQRRPNCR